MAEEKNNNAFWIIGTLIVVYLLVLHFKQPAPIQPVEQVQNVCTDTDFSLISTVKGDCNDGTNILDKLTGVILPYADVCKSNTILLEYGCNATSFCAAQEIDCSTNNPSGKCFEGACITTDCRDTDHGFITDVIGICSKSRAVNTDSCDESGNLVEYYCEQNDLCTSATFACSKLGADYVCNLGKCMEMK